MTSATRQRPSPSTPSHRTSRSYVHVGMDRSGAKTKRQINTVGIHGQPRRTGQVKKRGDNKWLISVYLGTDAAGKKLYSAKMVEGTRTEAEKQLRAFLSERDAGAVVAPSALTLDQHLDRWLDLVKIKIAERTAEDYKKWLAIYIRPELGSKRLSSLKTEDIQAVYSNMLKRKLASRTVRYAHTILSAALKQAVKWGLLASNPATDCTLPRKEQKEMRAMTLDEARRFIEAAKENRQGIVFLFALETGMRPEEYLGLPQVNPPLRSPPHDGHFAAPGRREPQGSL